MEAERVRCYLLIIVPCISLAIAGLETAWVQTADLGVPYPP